MGGLRAGGGGGVEGGPRACGGSRYRLSRLPLFSMSFSQLLNEKIMTTHRILIEQQRNTFKVLFLYSM